jgi:multicomponent Na+:H+ antiporter subunit E
MDVNLPTDFQLVILASIINTTPGTVTLDIATDKKVLYIHALHIEDPDAIVDGIRRNFENNIREIWE